MAETLVLVEDLDIVREGLRALLSSRPDYSVIGEAGDGLTAVNLVASTKPDVVLMDLHLPGMDGSEAVRQIRKHNHTTKIIALTADSKDSMLYKALKAGVDGYILKSATIDDLDLAIKTVLSGKPYISPDISPRLIEGYLNGGPTENISPVDALTERELQVLRLVAAGLSNKAAADKLCISHKTVEKHKANLKRKLNLTSNAQMLSFAIDHELIDMT